MRFEFGASMVIQSMDDGRHVCFLAVGGREMQLTTEDALDVIAALGEQLKRAAGHRMERAISGDVA